LIAQFIPVNENDWAVKNCTTLSSYRYLHPLQIVKPLTTIPKVNLSQSMEHKIGGLFGLGASVFRANIVFEKNMYYSGEIMRFKLNCDNT